MRRELSVPFVDSRADQLSHSLISEQLDALQTSTLHIDGLSVQLRILGSSHQVIIDGLTQPLIETVACGAAAADLPGQLDLRRDNIGYQFWSDVATHGAADFDASVRQLLATLDHDDRALVGVFPGDELAVTALQVHPAGVGWKTWHCYPNTGEIVTTNTAVSR